MDIEELMFKKTNDMLEQDKHTLLDIIKALQFDRRDWINQYTTIHNDYVILQQENQSLKDRIDKAINVLEKLQDWNYYDGLTCEQIREPLKILKGDDK